MTLRYSGSASGMVTALGLITSLQLRTFPSTDDIAGLFLIAEYCLFDIRVATCNLTVIVRSMSSSVRVAVTNHEPAWLDLEGGVVKTCGIIAEAARGGAKLVTFPECWIPGYPAWIW